MGLYSKRNPFAKTLRTSVLIDSVTFVESCESGETRSQLEVLC